MIATIIIFAITIVFMVLLGIVFSLGKGSLLLAGFNTLSEEEKDKYDTVALCKFMGKMTFALTFCVVLWLISVIYEMNWLLYFSEALFIGIIVFILIYVNKRNRFKK